MALCFWERPVLAYGALPGSLHGPRNPRVTRFSNARRPRPAHAPRKFLCRLKSPTSPTNDQNEPLKSRVCERLSWLGTWDVQTEESCLSTRGPRKLAFISASLAIAAATWMPPDAQRARADIGKKTGLAHVRNPGVAESLRLPLPTQRGETVRVTYVSMGACAHARGRFPRKSRAEKPGFRRREPSRVKLGSSRLSCPAWPSELPHVAIWGLRWPVRACPPASKQTFL